MRLKADILADTVKLRSEFDSLYAIDLGVPS